MYRKIAIAVVLLSACMEAFANAHDGRTGGEEGENAAVDEPSNLVTEPTHLIEDTSNQSEPSGDGSQSELSGDSTQSEAGADVDQSAPSTVGANQSESSTIAALPTDGDGTVGADQSNHTEARSPPSQSPASVRLKRRFNCTQANRTDVTGFVTLINSTDFAELRSAVTPPPSADPSTPANQSECAVLLYYLPYCPYSVSLAPHYNALARAFPQLHFFAVDADRVSPFYANYTTSVVPYIRIFRDKDFLGVNTSLRTLDRLVSELANLTGHQPEPNITVTEADHIGPVIATLAEFTDYWLVLSCLYFALLFPYLAAKLPRVRLGWARLRHRVALLLGGRRQHAD